MYVIRVQFHIVLNPATGIDNIEMNERWDNKDLDATICRYRMSYYAIC